MKDFIFRSSAALAVLTVIFVQSVHLALAVLAFDNLWGFIDLLIHNPAGRFDAALTVICAFGPLTIALLVARSGGARLVCGYRLHLLVAATTFYYALSIFLLGYRLEIGIAVDPFLVWVHLRDAWRTALILAGPQAALLFSLLILLCLYYRGVSILCRSLAARTQRGRACFWSLAALLIFVLLQWPARSTLANLLLEFHQPYSEARLLYARYYDDSIRRNQNQRLSFANSPVQDNLFIFHLESLNADLVNRQTTPRLLDIARRDGVLHSRIQSGSVFTILSMETLLCSVLPPIDRNLSLARELFGTLVCLPEIMRRIGYRTIYFQNFLNLDFANMDKFLESIGFDERHAGDIMQATDTQISWGFLEDIYYQRVFEYLRRYKDQKVFAYILVGATNHYPFHISEAHRPAIQEAGGLPHPAAKSNRERITNTTFLQDYYLGNAYEKHFRPLYAANSNTVILGDHSWPLGIHAGNENNLTIDGAYQENFLTAMAILPSANLRRRLNLHSGKTISELRTQLDFLPTMLDLYRVSGSRYYGTSFLQDLLAQDAKISPRNCLVSVQPFAGGSIAILQSSSKQIYRLRAVTVRSYDLARDPEERVTTERRIDEATMITLDRCLRSIQNAHAAQNP